MEHTPGFLKLVSSIQDQVRELSAEQLKTWLKDKQKAFVLIDCREESEWALGHISQAIHLSKGIIERDIESKIPDTTTCLVLYCGGGYRSALAADNIQKMGYSNVYSLKGGYRQWTEHNPVLPPQDDDQPPF